MNGYTVHCAIAGHAGIKGKVWVFKAALHLDFQAFGDIFSRLGMIFADRHAITLMIHRPAAVFQRNFRKMQAVEDSLKVERTLGIVTAIVVKTIGDIAVGAKGDRYPSAALAAVDDAGWRMDKIALSRIYCIKQIIPVLSGNQTLKFFEIAASVPLPALTQRWIAL